MDDKPANDQIETVQNESQDPQPAKPARDLDQIILPTKNKPALIGYYLGIFGLIPFLGIPFAVAAIFVSKKGLDQYKVNPTPGAKSHAMTGFVLGIFATTCFVLFVGLATLHFMTNGS